MARIFYYNKKQIGTTSSKNMRSINGFCFPFTQKKTELHQNC